MRQVRRLAAPEQISQQPSGLGPEPAGTAVGKGGAVVTPPAIRCALTLRYRHGPSFAHA